MTFCSTIFQGVEEKRGQAIRSLGQSKPQAKHPLKGHYPFAQYHEVCCFDPPTCDAAKSG